MKSLDCREMQCPAPVVETRKTLLATPGEGLQVLVADETARDNVSRLATTLGYDIQVSPQQDCFAISITPPGETPVIADAPEQPSSPTGKTVVYIASSSMGDGSEELGRVLMKNYLFTLTEMDRIPDSLFFVNGGVKLTTEGSDALEALQALADRGADIASCGLCLEYFELKEKLAVGRTTNMLDIAESMQSAGRIIRP